MVARGALNNMQQDRDEPIRSFGVRLHGQANICKYIMDCPSCNAEVNYTEPILRDVLCRGIIDPEIQLDLLGNTNQDMSLAEVFHFVEAKESGKRSAPRLFDSQAVDSIQSLYRKNKNMDNNPTINNKTKVCSYCSDTWKQKPSKSQPYINLRVEVATEDYGLLGFKNIKHPCLKPTMMPAMADTGCQSCLAGLECVQNLGLRKEDLIPVTMKMHAANNKVIHILGAAILHIYGTNKLGETVETHQITYITEFLSKQACTDLGMITENYSNS